MSRSAAPIYSSASEFFEAARRAIRDARIAQEQLDALDSHGESGGTGLGVHVRTSSEPDSNGDVLSRQCVD